jgi:hypothetical protein
MMANSAREAAITRYGVARYVFTVGDADAGRPGTDTTDPHLGHRSPFWMKAWA